MDVQKIYQDGDYGRACEAQSETNVRYDRALVDAAERLTCADLLERLQRPSYDHTPDGVMRAIEAAMRTAAAQRDRANRRAEDAEAMLADLRKRAEAAEQRALELEKDLAVQRERADDAEEKLERMHGSAEPTMWRLRDGSAYTCYKETADYWARGGKDVRALYEHPPAAPAKPAKRPIQVGDRVRLPCSTGRVVSVGEHFVFAVSDSGHTHALPAGTVERVED